MFESILFKAYFCCFRFGVLLDNNTSPFFSYLCAGRWLSVRLDALTITITVIISIFVVCSSVYADVFGSTTASRAGLALSYAITVGYVTIFYVYN